MGCRGHEQNWLEKNVNNPENIGINVTDCGIKSIQHIYLAVKLFRSLL